MRSKDFIINLINALSFYPILVLSIFAICSSIILVVGLLILLDNFARPNVYQYPFSIILDKVIPIVVLLTPIILPFTFSADITYFTRFTISLIIHCFFSVPLMCYWSYLRRWGDIQNSPIIYSSWNHPRLYKDVSIAIIYPLVFGLYFSLSRYFRLGHSLDINPLFYFFYTEQGVLILLSASVLIFYILYVIFAFIYGFIFIKNYTWNALVLIVYSIHIYGLRFFYYFKFTELLFKIHFVFHDMLSGSYGGTTYDITSCNIFRKFLSKVYYRPQPLLLLIPIFMLIEALLNSGIIYYSLYFTFYFITIFGLFRLFNTFGATLFVKYVCLSDYLSLNFKNPRFPLYFWTYVRNPSLHFGFSLTFDSRITQLIEMNSFVNDQRFSRLKFRRSWYLIDRVWGHVRSNSITFYNKNTPLSLSTRIAASLRSQTHLRFFHTTPYVLSPLPNQIHNLTPFCLKSRPLSLLALLNHPQQNYSILQKASKGILFPPPTTLYTVVNVMVVNKSKGLTETLEDNLAKTLSSLVNRGVIVGTYAPMKAHFGHPSNSMQARPDLVLQWKDSEYSFKGFLGVDQKHFAATNSGRNQIITHIDDYNLLLNEFGVNFSKKFTITPPIRRALFKLMESSSNFDNHLEVWSRNLHLFPDKWKAPLLLNKTFDESYLRPEIVDLIRKGDLEIILISERLYTAPQWSRKIYQICLRKH